MGNLFSEKKKDIVSFEALNDLESKQFEGWYKVSDYSYYNFVVEDLSTETIDELKKAKILDDKLIANLHGNFSLESTFDGDYGLWAVNSKQELVMIGIRYKCGSIEPIVSGSASPYLVLTTIEEFKAKYGDKHGSDEQPPLVRRLS
jgi:hypothetical protein